MYPRKVLYIEDDEDDIKRIQQGIDPAKFEIVGEIYGAKSLEILEADKPSQMIKAVLLDAVELNDPVTQLPQFLQADEVARRIREIRPDVSIFAVSWFRQGGLKVPVDGVYPKATLFSSPETFKDLEEALGDAIRRTEETSFYPDDGGGKSWHQKWGEEYIEFRNNSNVENDEAKIGQRARQDYDLLSNNEISETYRKYRGIDSLKNILIARRVIFATVFSNYSSDNGVVWREVSSYLGFNFPVGEEAFDSEMHEGLRNFMNGCGIKWGNIINRSTLLKEEEAWLKAEEFLNS